VVAKLKSCSVGVSSDAAFRCQYCGNLLIYVRLRCRRPCTPGQRRRVQRGTVRRQERDGDVIAVVTGSGRRDAGRHVYVLRRRQRVPAAQRCHDDGVDAGACDDWLPVNNQHHVSSSHRYCQTDFSRP